MSAVAWIEGRRLTTKLSSGFLPDADIRIRVADAKRGSAMLRDAILVAKGYTVPRRVAPPQAPIQRAPELFVPKFRKRAAKRGRPKGSRKARRLNPKIEQIKALVASHFGLHAERLMRPGRSYLVAHPRQVAMFLARKSTSASLPAIGWQFGGFDHTTVIHAITMVQKRIDERDEKTLAAVVAVHSVIGA
jgi:hypothetical protein